MYEAVSDYLRKDNAFGFTSGQKNLMILVFQKLLASSTFAISNTLNKMVLKLEQIADSKDLLDDDYDTFESVEEEWKNDDDQSKQLPLDIESELQELRGFANLANQIKLNAKGNELIKALKYAFEKTETLGALKKAVIFTESKITQKYLADLLSKNGYQDQIALINGVNNDLLSKQIYDDWLKKHSGSDKITGSKTVDIKAAIVEYFKNNASILIATEAAAEGINLQFCSLVVNYDLPWNPQRVEQRIGRCHRYGQKHDVVVVNFINQNNEADKRVYELLNEKFQLFNGVFGASDEVLGILESGIDIEKRISEIYQTCRTKEEINTAFDEIQKEFNDKIQSNYKNARQALLEHFDEEVSKRLKLKDEETKISLSDREKWLINLTKSFLKDKAIFHSPVNFTYENKNYYLDWKKSEENNGIFYRENHELASKILDQELKEDLSTGQIIFKYSDYPNKISVLDPLVGSKGYLELGVLNIDSLDTEEYLIFTATTYDGLSIDQETCKKLFQIPASKVNKDIDFNDSNLSEIRSENINKVLKNVSLENQSHFDSYILKLDQWAEDLKDDLERDLKEKQKQIQEAKKASRSSGTLKDKLEAQKKIKSLEKDRNRMRKELFNAQDNIEKERDELIQTTEKKLEPNWSINTLFQITWEIR